MAEFNFAKSYTEWKHSAGRIGQAGKCPTLCFGCYIDAVFLPATGSTVLLLRGQKNLAKIRFFLAKYSYTYIDKNSPSSYIIFRTWCFLFRTLSIDKFICFANGLFTSIVVFLPKTDSWLCSVVVEALNRPIFFRRSMYVIVSVFSDSEDHGINGKTQEEYLHSQSEWHGFSSWHIKMTPFWLIKEIYVLFLSQIFVFLPK